MSWLSVVTADSPLLWWRLDEATPGTGSAADSSGNVRDGTYVASPTSAASLTPSDPDTAVILDGSSQWVTSTYNPFSTGSDRTFECWFKRTSSTTVDAIWGGSQPSTQPIFRANISADTITFFTSAGASGQTWAGTLVPVGVVKHIVLTWTASTKVSELWLDAVSQGTKTHSTDFDVAPGNFNVGKRSTASDPCAGTIDEMAIYGAVLTTTQITAHYNAGIGDVIRPSFNPIPFIPIGKAA